MLEIERKFLVKSEDFKNKATKQTKIVQAYLNSHPERSVRIRIKGDKGFLTIKGKGNTSGTSRFEWEKQITAAEAEALLPLCEKGSIHKTRYEVPVGDHIFEVDEFYDANQGLLVAEVELSYENEVYEKPNWLGEEVTGDVKYYNSKLITQPFCEW
ncbi:CYTH domain-containing protein [Aquimarina agarilytica]|uniref:CYTH domain-containing protein n=1 Tax=Aquimarina agarilytica TaxID=1087449 RepID=UPI000287EB16|nr:CYTH domain-containing protein [Aquimarina agarilytica]